MKKKPDKDKHGKLSYSSGSVGELKLCLAPYIPFPVDYHPWLDKVAYNFKSKAWEVIRQCDDHFGKPDVSKHVDDNGRETWVRTFQGQGRSRIDLETYDVGRYKHGNIILYDNPSPELQSDIHRLMAGTGHTLSKLEYGVDLLPKTLGEWKLPSDRPMVVQAINALNYGCAPELVYLQNLVARLRWLTYSSLKLDFQYDRSKEFLTLYLGDPRNDSIALKNYIGPAAESKKTKTNFVRIELNANRIEIKRMIKRRALFEHGIFRPYDFNLKNRLRMREPRYNLILNNLVRKFGPRFNSQLHWEGFFSRFELNKSMCDEKSGLPLDQALLVQMWRELTGGNPPPYLFKKVFPAPSATDST